MYLDPHTTQKSGSIGTKHTKAEIEMDETYHCKKYLRINISQLDASLALCFLCEKESDLKEFFKVIEDRFVKAEALSIFNIGTIPQRVSNYLDDEVD